MGDLGCIVESGFLTAWIGSATLLSGILIFCCTTSTAGIVIGGALIGVGVAVWLWKLLSVWRWKCRVAQTAS